MTVSTDQVWHPWQNNQAGTGQAAGVWRRNNGHKRQRTYIHQTPDDDWREGKHPRRWETDQNPLGYHEHVKERQTTIMSACIRPLTLNFFFSCQGICQEGCRSQIEIRRKRPTPKLLWIWFHKSQKSQRSLWCSSMRRRPNLSSSQDVSTMM